MATSIALQEPFRVSPLIRVSRWAMLVTGVLYGAFHHRTLSAQIAHAREIYERERPALEAAAKEERFRNNREQMIQLANDTGTPIPSNF